MRDSLKLVAAAMVAILTAFGSGAEAQSIDEFNSLRGRAERGDIRAQFLLGEALADGRLVAKNYPEALKWYRKAAEEGHVEAQSKVAILYTGVEGIPKNLAEALKWFARAAEQGESGAQFFLGDAYMGHYANQGLKLARNAAVAAGWYARAARSGHAWAQYNLGGMYSRGEGIPQNYVEAHMWLNLAAANFGEHAVFAETRKSAITHRDALAAVMPPSQVAAAQSMAQQCRSTKYRECGSAPYENGSSSAPSLAAEPRPKPKYSTGTAFFVSADGHLVTNAHVVAGCRTIRSSRGGALSVVAVDAESDLALFLAEERPRSFAHLRGGRGVRTGETVVAAGYPLHGLLSSDLIVTNGIVSALSGIRNDRRTVQISAPVQPGNSGGPLHGANGSIVGVVVSKLDSIAVAQSTGDLAQNVNFAVSLGTLQSFLNANGVPYQINDRAETVDPADVAASAARYTVLIECTR